MFLINNSGYTKGELILYSLRILTLIAQDSFDESELSEDELRELVEVRYSSMIIAIIHKQHLARGVIILQ